MPPKLVSSGLRSDFIVTPTFVQPGANKNPYPQVVISPFLSQPSLAVVESVPQRNHNYVGHTRPYYDATRNGVSMEDWYGRRTYYMGADEQRYPSFMTSDSSSQFDVYCVDIVFAILIFALGLSQFVFFLVRMFHSPDGPNWLKIPIFETCSCVITCVATGVSGCVRGKCGRILGFTLCFSIVDILALGASWGLAMWTIFETDDMIKIGTFICGCVPSLAIIFVSFVVAWFGLLKLPNSV